MEDAGIAHQFEQLLHGLRLRLNARARRGAGLNHFVDCSEREQFRKNRAVR